jgi:general nucleoside transport system permease protein
MAAGAEMAAVTPPDETAVPPAGGRGPVLRRLLAVLRWLHTAHPAVLFAGSLACGLFVSSVVIAASTPRVRGDWGYLFSYPGYTLSQTFDLLGSAYGALLKGSIAAPSAFQAAFDHPSSVTWSTAFTPLSNTIVAAVPLVIAGVGLSLAFRSGAFNVGGQSQLIMGAVGASWVGFSFAGMPWLPHVLLGFAAAAVGGAIAGLIPGVLKALTGASEVIVTIMLNYVAANFLTYLLTNTFFRVPGTGNNPVGRPTVASATLGPIFGSGLQVNSGLIVTVIVVVFVAVLLNRSKLGFEFQIAGASRAAAKVAGIRQAWVYVGAFALSGAIVGLAGGVQILGVSQQLETGFGGDIGYLAILVAFVGANRPLGIALAGLLYGALEAGGLTMQFDAGISADMTTVIQSLIVLFITAPALVIGIFRLRQRGGLTS